MKRWRRTSLPAAAAVLAGLASAVLAAAASRPWGLGLLALVAYVPAFHSIGRAQRVVDGVTTAALASLGVATVGYEAAVGIFPGAYPLALLAAAAPFALVGFLAVRFRRSALARRLPAPWRPLAAASALTALWCAAEFVPARPELLGVWALPFGAIGYSQVDLPTASLARFSSVSAVSCAVLAVNAMLAALLEAVTRKRPRPAAGALTVLALLAGGVAAAHSSSPAPAEAAEVTLRLVQPNLRDSVYAAASEDRAVGEALAIAIAALASRPATPNGAAALTLLPEASWPGVLRAHQTSQAARLLAGATPLLMGAVTAGWSEPSREGWPVPAEGQPLAAAADERLANAVVLVAQGGLEHVYAKRRLVPLAEAGLRAGTGPLLVQVAGLSVAPFVCYDIVFPADVRAAARRGAELLAVLTDDSFAAAGDVPALHLRVAAMRAIETGVPVALASNTGPSGVVSPSGRIVALTPSRQAVSLAVSVAARPVSTPYVKHGDWVGNVATVFSLGLAAASVAGGGAVEFDTGPT